MTRKIILSIIASVVLLANPGASFAQGWVPFMLDVLDENLSDGNNLEGPRNIDFYGNTGYALGDWSTMYKSYDNGRSWIGASDDGVGDTWIGFDNKYSVNNLYALSSDNLAIVSSGKNIFTSNNAGMSFDANYLDFMQSSRYEWLLGSAQISNNEYLFVDGDHLYKTTDAFGSGSIVYTANNLSSDEYICSMSASDNGHGVILLLCNSDSLFVSSDAGKTFTKTYTGLNTVNADIDFASEDVVYMATGGKLYKSVDGGIDWDDIQTPNGVSRFGEHLAFLDENNGVAVAYAYGQGTQEKYSTATGERILFTSNGGDSWTLMNSLVAYDYEFTIMDLYYDDSDRIFASGMCDDGTSSALNGACILRYNTSEGILVKSEDSANVYYVGKDGLLHWISSEQVFYTWYDDFSSVETVSQDYINSLQRGSQARSRKTYEERSLSKVMGW